MSALYGLEGVIYEYKLLIVSVETRVFRNRFHADERSAGICFRLPYAVQGVAHFSENLLEFLSCHLLCDRYYRAEIEWIA